MSRRGQNSTGGTRKPLRNPFPDGRPAAYEPPPAMVALLRSIWEKRSLLSANQRNAVHDWLQRVQRGPLTEPQTAWAVRIGASLGIGYDDPAFDDPPSTASASRRAPLMPAGVLRVERWGALPAKPPGKA